MKFCIGTADVLQVKNLMDNIILAFRNHDYSQIKQTKPYYRGAFWVEQSREGADKMIGRFATNN